MPSSSCSSRASAASGVSSGFALAAGEFPQAGQVAAFGAAREQDAAARVADDAGDDVDGGAFRRSGLRLPRRDAVADPRLSRPDGCPPLAGEAGTLRQAIWPWQCLYFLPLPQGHGSLRPTRGEPHRAARSARRSRRPARLPRRRPGRPSPACWNCICRAMRLGARAFLRFRLRDFLLARGCARAPAASRLRA